MFACSFIKKQPLMRNQLLIHRREKLEHPSALLRKAPGWVSQGPGSKKRKRKIKSTVRGNVGGRLSACLMHLIVSASLQGRPCAFHIKVLLRCSGWSNGPLESERLNTHRFIWLRRSCFNRSVRGEETTRCSEIWGDERLFSRCITRYKSVG